MTEQLVVTWRSKPSETAQAVSCRDCGRAGQCQQPQALLVQVQVQVQEQDQQVGQQNEPGVAMKQQLRAEMVRCQWLCLAQSPEARLHCVTVDRPMPGERADA